MVRQVTRLGNSLGATFPADFEVDDDDELKIAHMDNDEGEITYRIC
jgi:antitoxin component of MazEF toxin-antitoxin module